VIRRRRNTVHARAAWAGSLPGRLINSQAAMALVTPRTSRVIDLLQLSPGKRFVDVGCGTAAYAHLLARQAGLEDPPLCLDLAHGPGPVDALAWPGALPLADASIDCLASFYLARRLDDDQLHDFGNEISRVLAPGGRALVLEVAPVRSATLNRFHQRLLRPGCVTVDLRGWGRMAALFTECGFDSIDLVSAGPFLLPPIPRIGVLLRRA
jgi:SAM-dependent methyltransferase